MSRGNKSLFAASGHMTKMAGTPIYVKKAMALGLGMQHWGHGPIKYEKMIMLGFP